MGWEISNIYIGKLGIFKLADVEMELCGHCLEASDHQLHIHVSDVHLIVAVIVEKEIINWHMPDANPSIGLFISI